MDEKYTCSKCGRDLKRSGDYVIVWVCSHCNMVSSAPQKKIEEQHIR